MAPITFDGKEAVMDPQMMAALMGGQGGPPQGGMPMEAPDPAGQAETPQEQQGEPGMAEAPQAGDVQSIVDQILELLHGLPADEVDQVFTELLHVMRMQGGNAGYAEGGAPMGAPMHG